MRKTILVFLSCLTVMACSTSDNKESVEPLPGQDSLADKPLGSKENTAKLYSDLKGALVTKDDTMVERSTATILSVNSADVKTLNALAMHHAQKKRFALAELILKKAEKNEGYSYVTYNNLGVINFLQGNKREGIGYFKKSLMAKSDYGIAASNLGSYFAEVKDYGKARLALEVAYKAGVRDLNTLNNYAISLMAIAQPADEVFDQGMKVGNTNVDFLTNYCIYLVEVKKDLSKAKVILEKINFTGSTSERRDVIKNLAVKINEAQNK